MYTLPTDLVREKKHRNVSWNINRPIAIKVQLRIMLLFKSALT